MDSATQLQSAQSQTSSLLAQQQKYAEVRSAERDTTLLGSAQAVAGSTEIDWDSTLSSVASALPTGVQISGMTISAADATHPFEQSTVALDKPRIATLQFTVISPTIPSVPDWTDRLSGITGYVDSSISSIALKEDTGDYTATIGLDLDEKAYDGKYTKDTDK
ncbi:hypothetical protein [Curtobacterium sp. ZW137]|uniref:hypothetical protein n=1 Tax=Curtobacterium sp. ZW137 TaxID=2485104 RepID=UPI00160F3CC4|nr:hypothetical protein [Curtobacterium sp. ZW137]